MLRCVSQYKSNLGAFPAGHIIDDAQVEAWLVADSPESFEQVEESEEPVKSFEPDQEKIVRRSRTK
jgi:hypothetical protein